MQVSVALLLLPACASTPAVTDASPPVLASPALDTGLDLVQRSPLGQAIARTAPLMQAACASMAEELPLEDQEQLPLLLAMLGQAFDEDLLLERVLRGLQARLSGQELATIQAWQRQHAALIERTHQVNHSSPQQRLDWWSALPPDPRQQHLELAQQMVPAYISRDDLRQTWVALFSNAAWILLETSAATSDALEHRLRLLVAGAVRATGLEQLQDQDLHLGLMYALRDAPLDQQRAFASFWSSSLGQRYHQALWSSYHDAIKDASTETAALLSSR